MSCFLKELFVTDVVRLEAESISGPEKMQTESWNKHTSKIYRVKIMQMTVFLKNF